jgi:RNA polymerase sigma-70 factor (ECF subfamily)
MLEKKLIQKCRSKDGKAFELLMQNYRRQLFSYLLRFCGNRMTAEDLFQETLIKVWRGIESYNERNKFSSWLFSIAHNVAVDAARSASTKKLSLSVEETYDYEDNNNPHKNLVEKEQYEMVMIVVNELPEKQKDVFLLRQHSGMSFKEIAKEMNQPLNTVLGHMHYAVAKIRKKLSKEYG